MPRNRNSLLAARRGALTALLAGVTLVSPALGQSKVPPGRAQAAVVAQSPASAVAPAADLRAQIWGTTARFVYADDPALAKVRPELEQTIDDASLKALGRSLDDAVRAEQRQAPGQNHVLKFQGIFKETQALNLNPNDATGLVNAIRTKLESNADRMNDPMRRQRLAALVAQLTKAAASGGSPVTAPAAAEVATSADPGAAALTQAGEADTASTTPEASLAPVPTTPPAPVTNNSMLPIISLLLSALSLLGVLFLFLTRNQTAPPLYRPETEPVPPPRKQATDPLFSITQYQELQKVIRKEIAAAAAAPAPGRPVANQKQQAQRPAPTPSPKAAAPATPAAAATPPPSLSELAFAEPAAPAPVAPPIPRLRTIYVNQQPLDGAFRRDNLADAPASYTIFEISVDEQSPDYGTFVVTRNEAAHSGYIGSHHSILEPACVYNYPQGAVSRIITDTPGIVQRQQSGDWHISQKARIHFA